MGGLQHRPIARRTNESYEECKRARSAPKTAEALLMLEGNKLALSCPVCLKPTERSFGIWKRAIPETATFIPIRFDGLNTRLLSDMTLEIMNAKKKDSGIYLCIWKMEVMAKYSIDIVQAEPHRYIIMNEKRKLQSRVRSMDVALKTLNLVVGLSWSEWSQCNRCGKVGRRRRVGICMVRKLNVLFPSKPIDTQLLSEFKKGIPCRSQLLPQEIRNISDVYNMKSEFMIGFCKIPCSSEASIMTITDKTGAIIDTVDNSQGIYSMHQPLPVPKLVSRRAVYEGVGKSIVMMCPGNKNNKFLIWRNNSFVINPSKVHILTKGRVKIDFQNNLHIRKLFYFDSSIYSCWDDKNLIGTIRLQVTDKTNERRYRMYILNMGVLFTFLIISIVSFTICRNARLQTKQ